ncbi:MAG: alpha-ketoglutarate-dependent dioxygenase AlkB [Rhizobacter sp.]|nr:alpha-ketoglutarate-dependent dioxygenase AlkB [Chlorobiales bacterium]
MTIQKKDSQMSLWNIDSSDSKKSGRQLMMEDGDVVFHERFFGENESNRFYQELYSTTRWRQDEIKIYGKKLPLPRLTAWYGDEGKAYTYSKIQMLAEAWTSPMLAIKSRIEIAAGVRFNSVLLNLYRDGRDSMSWHSDDEHELGINPVIGSVSFGESRRFIFKHKIKTNLPKVEVELSNGSLLIMQGRTQHFWVHQVPRTAKPIDPRINLTFRIIH